jgi:hypothetical protein
MCPYNSEIKEEDFVNCNTVIPRFTSLISSSKISRKAKTRKTIINFQEEAPGTTISLREEGAQTSENWFVK